MADSGSDRMEIRLDELMARMRTALAGASFDLVVAVARGGVLPGYLASRLLALPLEIVRLNLRDESHAPVRERPELLRPLDFSAAGKRVLLCDDVSNSGATLRAAAEAIGAASVATLVISGTGDYSLFGPHDRCIDWPWD